MFRHVKATETALVFMPAVAILVADLLINKVTLPSISLLVFQYRFTPSSIMFLPPFPEFRYYSQFKDPPSLSFCNSTQLCNNRFPMVYTPSAIILIRASLNNYNFGNIAARLYFPSCLFRQCNYDYDHSQPFVQTVINEPDVLPGLFPTALLI